jgi:hypothetical protein
MRDKNRKKIRVGDYVHFESNLETLVCKITECDWPMVIATDVLTNQSLYFSPEEVSKVSERDAFDALLLRSLENNYE